MDPNHVTQKYTVAGEYNELFDDVQPLTDTTYTTLEDNSRVAINGAAGIRDLGIGNVICVTSRIVNASLVATGIPGSDAGRCLIPLTEMIKSMHYTGTGELTYTLSDENFDPSPLVGGSPSTDPSDIFVVFNLDYIGMRWLGLEVTDGSVTCQCFVYMTIDDPTNIAGA